VRLSESAFNFQTRTAFAYRDRGKRAMSVEQSNDIAPRVAAYSSRDPSLMTRNGI